MVELLQLIDGSHQLPLLPIVQLVGQQVFPVEGAPGGFPADHRADTGHGLVQSIGHRQIPLTAAATIDAALTCKKSGRAGLGGMV